MPERLPIFLLWLTVSRFLKEAREFFTFYIQAYQKAEKYIKNKRHQVIYFWILLF